MATFNQTPSEPQSQKKTATHDTQSPPNLLSFMMKGWQERKPLKGVVKNAAQYRKRREALSKLYPGEVLILPTGHQKVRSNDTFFRFRPASDFYYLTGCTEHDCVLVLVPDKVDTHHEILFFESNPGRTTAQFFTDRIRGELWEGPRLGLPEAQKYYQITEVKSLTELESFIRALVVSHPNGCRVLRGFGEEVDRLVHPESPAQIDRDFHFSQALHDMRLYKDSTEVKEISLAIDSTKRGFEDVIRVLKKAKSERELEGAFYTRARTEGNDVGYYSIVASGAHACVLHWKKNDGRIKKGDLLLLDAGVEGNSLYTADITRTLPISGKFSKEQRAIYDLVRAAQVAALKAVKPGNDYLEPNRAAMAVLAKGLHELGILKETAEEALKDENQFYKRYSLHNVSHMLGLDVHDCAKARAENYKYGILKPGMVITVEPGLYFQEDDLTVPKKYRGIGVRIEDDVLVTEKGHRNLSAAIPADSDAVEKWMKKLMRG